MKKILYILIPVALIVLMAVRLKGNKEISENRVYHYDKEQVISVRADTLKLADVDAEYSFTGTFHPNKESKISAETQGKINVIYIDEGSSVKKGQALIQLDNSLLKLQLQSIELQIEGFETDVKRYTILAQADAVQGIQLEKAELGLKAAKIQKSTLLAQITKTTIRAPFSGVVSAKLTEIGAFAAPGMPLLQISDIARLKFRVNVPEAEVKLFEKGRSYRVTVDAYPEIKHSSTLSMIGVKGNMANRFPIQFSVKNTTDLKIKSGMFGKVVLADEKGNKQLIIPASAIVSSGIRPEVYVVEKGKATLRSIIISKRIQDKLVIESGLEEGDVIIVGGFINLFEGANVVAI